MTTISQESHAVHALTTFDTDIVVDLGCCTYQRSIGGQEYIEDSIHALIKRFKPQVLFGFDPHPALPDMVGQVYGTAVITARRAAWIVDGTVGLELQGNCTHVDAMRVSRHPADGDVMNPNNTTWSSDGDTKAFDLAAWVRALPEAKIVLKVDVEGAEYVLLPHLIEQGLMDRFSLLLVEWHTESTANGYESDRNSILEGIECPVEEWQ